jgi:RNA polymerase sigma-70 factor (ECF subfamily)
MFEIAYRIVKNQDNAEDIVQDVFIHIWNKREELNITSTIEGYLVKSTVNKSISYLEKNKKNIHIELNDLVEFETHSKNKSSNYDDEILKNLIEASLDNLPPKCKAIFVLSRFEKMKNKDIAAHLEVSIKTVENQMTIALSKLNSELKPKLLNYFPDLFLIFILFLNLI